MNAQGEFRIEHDTMGEVRSPKTLCIGPRHSVQWKTFPFLAEASSQHTSVHWLRLSAPQR